MRNLALGLLAVLACASGCTDPLARDNGGDAGGGGGGGNDGTAPPSPPGDAGNPVTPHDAGDNGGHDGAVSDTGAPPDAGTADTSPPPGDGAPPPTCSEANAAWVAGSGISTTGWTATATPTAASDGTPSDAVTANAFDNNLTTRWSHGQAQSAAPPLAQFTLNLGSAQSISQVALFFPGAGDAGTTDFPAGYTLGLSTDGTTFTTVATGVGASPTAICFPAQQAQYVKITETGTSGSWFSIYEIQVFH